MAFYSPDAAMGQRLNALVDLLQRQQPIPERRSLAITWLRFPLNPQAAAAAGEQPRIANSSERVVPRGASLHGAQLQDPGVLVALPCLLAVEQWIRDDRLQEDPELRRALEALGRRGSAEAHSHVLDRLSGTTSGPELPPQRLAAWQRQRRLLDGWLGSLGWPELEGASACHRIWAEGPYGRDRQLLEQMGGAGNRCSTEALARLLTALVEGSLVSPPACGRLRALLRGGPVSTLSGMLPGEMGIWGLGACSGAGLQLAVYGEPEGAREPQLLVLLAGGSCWARDPAPLNELVQGLLGWSPQQAVPTPKLVLP